MAFVCWSTETLKHFCSSYQWGQMTLSDKEVGCKRTYRMAKKKRNIIHLNRTKPMVLGFLPPSPLSTGISRHTLWLFVSWTSHTEAPLTPHVEKCSFSQPVKNLYKTAIIIISTHKYHSCCWDEKKEKGKSSGALSDVVQCESPVIMFPFFFFGIVEVFRNTHSISDALGLSFYLKWTGNVKREPRALCALLPLISKKRWI